MAKGNKRRRRPKLITRAINAGLTLLALSPALREVFANINNPGAIPTVLLRLYTAGLSDGKFNPALAGQAYGAPAAAFILKLIITMTRRKFPF